VLGDKGGARSARLPVEIMRHIHDGVRRACERDGREPSTLANSSISPTSII
jgi:hypothetical protein